VLSGNTNVFIFLASKLAPATVTRRMSTAYYNAEWSEFHRHEMPVAAIPAET